MGFRLVPK